MVKHQSALVQELSETSDILAGATERSLVIIDELGRGTSTHDGLAIAQASLHHLVASTRCLTLFVTHYPKVDLKTLSWINFGLTFLDPCLPKSKVSLFSFTLEARSGMLDYV